jgi:hypothetical protein
VFQVAQYNGQKKKDKGTNNDLQNITHKARDLVTQTPLVSVPSGMPEKDGSVTGNRGRQRQQMMTIPENMHL